MHHRHHATPRLATDATCAASPSLRNCISHVVIIVQENRSFNNLFEDFPGAETTATGKKSSGATVSITVRSFGQETPDPYTSQSSGNPDHSWSTATASWDGPTNFVGQTGKMDGFDQNSLMPGDDTYSSVSPDKLDGKPYRDLASTYTLADHMFPTQFGPSYTAHISLIAANTILASRYPDALVDFPNSEWGCPSSQGWAALIDASRTYIPAKQGLVPNTCYTNADMLTLANTLDAADLTWKYYAPRVYGADYYYTNELLWSAFTSFDYVRDGPCQGAPNRHSCWAWNVKSPPGQVITDINSATNDTFPNVVWVIPRTVNSDHAGDCAAYEIGLNRCSCPGKRPCTSNTGPSWVGNIFNAIHANHGLWRHTAVIVVWDDWGGWYDEVSPPQLDNRGLGIRVPCIIASPYVKKGHVSKTRYEFGSIIKFVEQVFGLPVIGPASLGYTDATHGGSTVNSISDRFDFTQTPEDNGAQIDLPYSAQYFVNQTDPDVVAPDTE